MSSFPAYDQMKGGGKGSKSKGKDEFDMNDDPESYLVNTLQDNINKARRAEQKVRALIATHNKKAEMWRQYVDSMKASYMQELQRHQKDVSKVESDLEAALAMQEEARRVLRSTISLEQDPRRAARAAQEEAWQEMTGQWRQEREHSEDANAVLQRALAACGLDREKFLQAVNSASSPSSAQRASYGPPPGFPADPWANSPSMPTMPAPPKQEAAKTPTATPTRTRQPNSADRKPVKPVVVPPMQKPKPGGGHQGETRESQGASPPRRERSTQAAWESQADQAADVATAATPKEIEIVDDDSMEEADRLHNMG